MRVALFQEAKSLSPYLEDIFFQLHKNPELGGQEYKTQAFILAELEKMGIEAKPIAETGVLGIIRGEKPGKTVAFRADMDALPVMEETGLDYKSQTPGVMHACGHDAHVTILLGAAKLLAARKDSLQGNIKLFFQPNEEGTGGAQRMIQAGCMENPAVDAVFFGHCTPDHPVGTVGVCAGSTSAASNAFTVTFRGKGTHGAHPNAGTDVIVAACQAVTALQTICSRRISPLDSAVVTVGAFHAGTVGNILPETATIDGIIRTLTPETRVRAKEAFCQIVSGVAAAMGVTAEIDLRDGYAATVNDEEMTGLTIEAAQTLLGKDHVYTNEKPTLGTEDIGYFLQEAPGCYYKLGVGDVETGDKAYPLHNPRFVVDLKALPYGVALYVQIAENFLKEG